MALIRLIGPAGRGIEVNYEQRERQLASAANKGLNRVPFYDRNILAISMLGCQATSHYLNITCSQHKRVKVGYMQTGVFESVSNAEGANYPGGIPVKI